MKDWWIWGWLKSNIWVYSFKDIEFAWCLFNLWILKWKADLLERWFNGFAKAKRWLKRIFLIWMPCRIWQILLERWFNGFAKAKRWLKRIFLIWMPCRIWQILLERGLNGFAKAKSRIKTDFLNCNALQDLTDFIGTRIKTDFFIWNYYIRIWQI